MPYNPETKYVYVMRNPKDIFVSSYYADKGYEEYNYQGTFDDHFNLFMNGQLPYGDYFEHLSSFIPHLNDENVLHLYYEQMIANPKQSVLKIADFLGKEFAEKLNENNGLILNKVLEYSSFESMRNNPTGIDVLTRKGIVGDWRSLMTKTQSDLIDKKFHHYFNGTDIEKTLQEYMKWE